ncbi:hypothetical protein AAFF_G00207630 [Aldrovandia affinis]|uniref:Homeobox protein B3 n=1 Tax=Aldrovandia affinis TaxID=143900 RepID=A0AAD7RHJ3_9TELE|nr:hypothetical protein AAFF_G00207630 [Aldrovandia affinis]
MQKTTYYDNSTLFGGYSYQGANGFGYDAPQPAYQSSAHLENDYQRSACSLQSLGNGTQQQHAKTKELNGSCMRPSLPPEHHQVPPVSPTQNPANSTNSSSAQQSSSSGGATLKTAPSKTSNLPPNPTITKQIFPWMKESRQNSKQKNSSPSASTANAESCSGEKSPPGSAASKRAHGVHERAAGGVREGVPLQSLPVQASARGDGQPAEPKRTADQNLVPEPENEVQKRSKVEGDGLLLRWPLAHRKSAPPHAVVSWFYELHAPNDWQLRCPVSALF